MIVKDWMQEVAREIEGEPYADAYGEEEIHAILLKRCSFKPDIVYMPVPRCDQCKHWLPRVTTLQGTCLKAIDRPSKMWPSMYDDVITEPDFGCVQWEAK